MSVSTQGEFQQAFKGHAFSIYVTTQLIIISLFIKGQL